MTTPILLTYSDAVAHCRRFMEGRGNAGKSVIRGAIMNAYTTLTNAFDWTALTGNGRIHLKGTQTTGTIVYDHTGGSSERLVTLSGTGAEFPTEAADYAIRFNGVVSDIERYVDSTHVTLDTVMNPGADVASTSYVLYPRWYALPADFVAMYDPAAEDWQIGTEVTMSHMMRLDRLAPSTGSIVHFAIGQRADTYGYKALYTWPAASSDATLDFIYYRRPRNLRHSGHESVDYTGTISVTSGSPTVTGTSTSFATSMNGAVIRFGTSSVRPDWEYGDNPYKEQRSIRSVNSTTGITLDANASITHTNVRYRITDPIDLHQEAHTAFLRYCEYNMGIGRGLDGTAKMLVIAENALKLAMAGSSTTRSDPVYRQPYAGLYPAPGGVDFSV